MVLNRIQGERKGLEEIVNLGQTIQEAEAVPLQEAKRHNLQDTGEYWQKLKNVPGKKGKKTGLRPPEGVSNGVVEREWPWGIASGW